MDRSVKKAATISDVAALAGVSTATVSHVLNKTRFVSDELTLRVMNAIDSLGFYPNQLVGALRGHKSYSIGLVIPSISNETYGALADKIQRLLLEQGENLIICNTSYDGEMEKSALTTLMMKKADALISIPTADNIDMYLKVRAMDIPIVFVDREIAGFATDTVMLDNKKGAIEAVRYLVSLGHRHICYIDRKLGQSHSNAQREGYIDGLNEAGITKRYIFTADGYDYDAGIKAGRAIVSEMPEVTAIFGYYDVIAFGAMRGVIEAGLRVPEDISIVGFDAMPFAMAASPRLTSVKFPVSRIASLVNEIITKRLASKKDRSAGAAEYERIVLVPEIIHGESTAPIKRRAHETVRAFDK